MDTTVIRYCPACGARVKAPESAFEGPCACPTCHERSQFYDYPREMPATPPKLATRSTTSVFDRLLWGALVVASLAALVVLWALLEGRANAALIGSGVCLVAALALVGHVVRLKRNLLRSAEAQKRAERALVVSNSKLQAASEIQRGFKKNFDALVADEKRRLQAHIAARQESAEAMHAEAEEHLKRVGAVEQVQQVKQVKHIETSSPAINIVGDRLLEDCMDRLSRQLDATNFSECRSKLMDVIRFCRENGCKVNPAHEAELLSWLEKNHQTLMLEAEHKSERERIEEKMQEEESVLREFEQQIRNAKEERSALQKKLAEVLQKSQGEENEETEYLREKIDAAEKQTREADNAIRQPTTGYVYVLSNVGSFGRNVFKIGTTRQLDPRHHVDELSGAAVPFPYDVHMMIASENAAELEAILHKALHDRRINRFNHSKNFFETDIQTIWKLVVANYGTVDYVSEPIAKEFKESQDRSDNAQGIADLHRTPEMHREPSDLKG